MKRFIKWHWWVAAVVLLYVFIVLFEIHHFYLSTSLFQVANLDRRQQKGVESGWDSRKVEGEVKNQQAKTKFYNNKNSRCEAFCI